MRLATLDIGTNTAQLLVVERDGTGLRRLHAAERVVRLGEGVDAHGRIGAAARDRLLHALHAHMQVARDYAVDTVSAAGTSALRDAQNRTDILAAVQAALGLSIDILAGDEEAAWSFAAACAAFDDLRGPCLVVDIGGGSTELVAGRDPSRHRPAFPDAITDRASLNVGCVRLTERCFSSQPPPSKEIDTAAERIDEALAASSLALDANPTLIGTAGTATALARVDAGPETSWNTLHGSGFSLSGAAVRRWRDRLLQQTVDEIRALHPAALKGRADVFPIGVMIMDSIMDRYDRDTCRVSPYELRHGLALRALR